MTNQALRDRLLALAEPAYRDFIKKLLPLPVQDSVLGVRLPVLRRLAAENARTDGEAFLAGPPGPLFEERMLHGMVIGRLRLAPEQVQAHIDHFLPYIDNWSVCDSFCAGLKQVQTNPESYWRFLQPYLYDGRPYARRFAVVLLLDYFVDAAHIAQLLSLLEGVPAAERTVQMAVAWAASECCARFPEETLAWLSRRPLAPAILTMTAQKIADSRRVLPAVKARARVLCRPVTSQKDRPAPSHQDG